MTKGGPWAALGNTSIALSSISSEGGVKVGRPKICPRVWDDHIPPVLQRRCVVGIAAGLSVMLAMLPASAAADYWRDNQCTLDKPRPVLTGAGFKLNTRDGIATESLALGDGIVMRLEQSACEYLTRTYTFIMKQRPSDADIVGWQYQKAVQLLSLLEERSNRKVRLTNEKRAVDQYSRLVVDPKEDVEINVKPPHDQFSEIVSIVSQVEGDETRIIVKVSSGPY